MSAQSFSRGGRRRQAILHSGATAGTTSANRLRGRHFRLDPGRFLHAADASRMNIGFRKAAPPSAQRTRANPRNLHVLIRFSRPDDAPKPECRHAMHFAVSGAGSNAKRAPPPCNFIRTG